MRKAGWIVVTFAAMYLIATIVGFATYLLISPRAMWISVFTLMPIASAALIYGYLCKMQFSRDQSPWIWFSYAVLSISAVVGRWMYLRKSHA